MFRQVSSLFRFVLRFAFVFVGGQSSGIQKGLNFRNQNTERQPLWHTVHVSGIDPKSEHVGEQNHPRCILPGTDVHGPGNPGMVTGRVVPGIAPENVRQRYSMHVGSLACEGGGDDQGSQDRQSRAGFLVKVLQHSNRRTCTS